MNVCVDVVLKRMVFEVVKVVDKLSFMVLECVFVWVCVCDGNVGLMLWSSIVGVV